MRTSARTRFLVAMGLVPSAVVACRSQTNAPEVAVVADPNGETKPTTTATTPASATPSATATATATGEVIDTVDEPRPPPPGRDGGSTAWVAQQKPVGKTLHPDRSPPLHMPTCPSGAFCVAGPAYAPDGGPTAPAPYTDCPFTADAPNVGIGGTGVHFSAEITKTEREAVRDACCYTWFQPCPGGRRLTSAGEAVTAPNVARDDWGSCDPGAFDGDAETRARLARHWLAEAAAEHASVASFSRFALQLLALGAPRDLVAAAHAAALDEIRHAEHCYALASRASGEPTGPGPLAIPDGALATDAAAVAFETLRDGCLGETVASSAAAKAARAAADPEVSAVLARIAEDEEAHAELAFRTVAWLVATYGEPVRRVAGAFLEEMRRVEAEDDHAAHDDAPHDDAAHGVLTPAARLDAQRSAVRDVVRPCLEALLAA